MNDCEVQPRSVVGVVGNEHQQQLLARPTNDGSRAALPDLGTEDRKQNDDG